MWRKTANSPCPRSVDSVTLPLDATVKLDWWSESISSTNVIFEVSSTNDFFEISSTDNNFEVSSADVIWKGNDCNNTEPAKVLQNIYRLIIIKTLVYHSFVFKTEFFHPKKTHTTQIKQQRLHFRLSKANVFKTLWKLSH